MTDWGTTMAGFFVDDISRRRRRGHPVPRQRRDARSGLDGQRLDADPGSSLKTHYYMMEWRNLNAMETPYDGSTIVNFDNGLRTSTSTTPTAAPGNPNEPWYFSYAPGTASLLPGHALHGQLDRRPPGRRLPAGRRLEATADVPAAVPGAAATSPGPSGCRATTRRSASAGRATCSSATGASVKTYQGVSAVPDFDDSKSYWSSKIPDASVKTPTYGIILRVAGQAADGSAAVIGIGRK